MKQPDVDASGKPIRQYHELWGYLLDLYDAKIVKKTDPLARFPQ